MSGRESLYGRSAVSPCVTASLHCLWVPDKDSGCWNLSKSQYPLGQGQQLHPCPHIV